MGPAAAATICARACIRPRSATTLRACRSVALGSEAYRRPDCRSADRPPGSVTASPHIQGDSNVKHQRGTGGQRNLAGLAPLIALGTAAGDVLGWIHAHPLRRADTRTIAGAIGRPETSARWGLYLLRSLGLLPPWLVQPPQEASTAGWLRAELAGGPIHANEIRVRATKAGFAWRTVQRAAATLRVRSKRRGYGGRVFWSLPEEKPT